mmetsp:Transcript_13528/g.27541  ORF Transcript_13528/g.27541 Transcript_13528/m.27541 type:complete len:82 (+) Transcript_13528:1826-2071(+)
MSQLKIRTYLLYYTLEAAGLGWCSKMVKYVIKVIGCNMEKVSVLNSFSFSPCITFVAFVVLLIFMRCQQNFTHSGRKLIPN